MSATGRDTASRERALLVLVAVGALLSGASVTMLTVALPVVVRDLGATAVTSTWLLLVPFLVTAVLMVPCGRLADARGHRPVFLGGLVVTTVSAPVAALAATSSVLLVAGAVQAVGLAMVLCGAGAIVASTFTGRRLGRAMGVYVAGISASQVLGPAAGGLIADTLGWRWLYWVQIPVGVAAVAAAAVLVPGPPRGVDGPRRSLDLPGCLVLAAVVGTCLGALAGLQELSAAGIVVPVLAGCSLLLLPLLYLTQRRARDPILPPVLLRSRAFLLLHAGTMVSMLPRFVSVTAAGLYFQTVLLDPARTAGLKVLPLPLAITAGSLLADRAARRYGPAVAGSGAAAAMAAGALLLAATADAGLPYGWALAGLTVLGGGAGVHAAVCSTLLIRRTGPGDGGSANGLRLTLMTVAEVVLLAGGLALVTAGLPEPLRAAFYAAALTDPAHRAVLADGFTALFVATAVAAVVAGLAVAAARDRTAPEGGDR
ncbi:MFS transporter [Pseudonocardia alni]|uniref:MFS transporter n=1 Tax=Pseudonocardia alni TaxID=33907 RepID=UPI003409AB26